MTLASSTISAVARTTFKIGTYSALTDVWSSVADLNDRVNFWLVSVDMPQPRKIYSRTGNIRVAGEKISTWNYQNRHIKLTINLLYGASATALLNAVRTLLNALENPPYRLAFAAPNTTLLSYADVVAVNHTIPYESKLILNGAIKKITIDFECLPGLPGDRLALSNQAVNPGFEAPSGPGVTAFTDTFANVSGYSVVSGSAPTVASNVMTVAAASTIKFGSPTWGPINQWLVRFKWVTGLTAGFDLHFTNASNKLQFNVTTGSQNILQFVGGVSHTVGTGTTAALTNGNFYWAAITQYPVEPSRTPLIQAQLFNDSAGAVGTSVASIAPAPTFDAVTALSGQMALEATGAALAVGGAFSNVNWVRLFGPGAWIAFDFLGNNTYAPGSYGWEQNTANTYPSGPFTSYGAARFDVPPAGLYNMSWNQGDATSLTTLIQTAIPVAAATDVISITCRYKASGISANGAAQINANCYNASGAFISTTFAIGGAKTGATGWVTLGGTFTPPANTAFIIVVLTAYNGATAGQDANGTYWFDNVQVYDQTTTGQTSMPYCELRYAQSPSQPQVSGLLGDLPVGANVSAGFITGASFITSAVWYLGGRATPQPGAQLVLPSYREGLPGTNGDTQLLSTTAYGGTVSQSTGNGAIPSQTGSESWSAGNTEAALQGAYHAFLHIFPGDTHYSGQTVQLYAAECLNGGAGPTTANVVGNYPATPQSLPVAASQWQWADMSLLTIPFGARLSTEDLTLKLFLIDTVLAITVTPNGNWQFDVAALLPVDGDTLAIAFSHTTVPNQWIWFYNTPDTPYVSGGWRFSVETVALPQPAHAGGGVPATAVQSQPYVAMASIGSSYIRLDPTQKTGLDGSAIGQMASVFNDTFAGTMYAMHYDLSYTPQYLWPRTS